jgi:hypothetical protein
MLKAAKIVLNLSKFPDSSSKNLNQVNLLAEFKRENNPIQNENCGHTCQNICNELMFDRMILNYFHINTLKTKQNMSHE